MGQGKVSIIEGSEFRTVMGFRAQGDLDEGFIVRE